MSETRKLVLVTGSRAFDGHESAAVVRERIRWLVHSLRQDDVVINGGAVGPDKWSSQHAGTYGVKYVELYPNGERHENGRLVGRWSEKPQHPLDRNRMLVEFAVKAKGAGWNVVVHAYVAPWSKTGGTGHTAALARAHGLHVETYEHAVAEPPPVNGMAVALRAPCKQCGGHTGTISVRGGQNVVNCAACGTYAGFNAPKAETGERGEAARLIAEAMKSATVVEPEPITPFCTTVIEEAVASIAPPVRPDVVWIDLETGGTSPKAYSIIEIGAVHSDPSSLGVLRTFETKIALPPGFSVDPRAAIVNGYDPAAWRGAPSIREALTKFRAWLPETFVAAGYNHSFDKTFMKHWYEREGIPLPGWVGDGIDPLFTVRKTLKKQGFMDNAKLDSVCTYFGISNEVSHRALADAERARLVFLRLLGKMETSSLFDQELVG